MKERERFSWVLLLICFQRLYGIEGKTFYFCFIVERENEENGKK